MGKEKEREKREQGEKRGRHLGLIRQLPVRQTWNRTDRMKGK